MQVITYTTVRGNKVHLTAEQVSRLHQTSHCLRDKLGDPFAQVMFGAHEGEPSYTDAQIENIIAEGE